MMSSGDGRIVTFYSYKGGTGRSMALAHAAWIMATRGYRVLAIDWDLEAPGLHRYFAPFLDDGRASSSDGLIDFLMNYCDAATTPPPDPDVDDSECDGEPGLDEDPLSWVDDYTEIWRYAQPVNLPDIACGGCLDFVNAGRQDDMYGTRVSLFDWGHFYENLGGGAFLNRMRAACISSDAGATSTPARLNTLGEAVLRPRYDFVFIDSRTGLSDTSGICTAQLPDTLVCLFTYNVQSIEGAARVLRSARAERAKLIAAGTSSRHSGATLRTAVRVIPVPSRAELGDTVRLSQMRKFALPHFAEFLDPVCVATADPVQSLIDVELPYVLTLSYNEVLSLLDEPTDPKSYLGILHRLTDRICPDHGGETLKASDRALANAMWAQYQDVLKDGTDRGLDDAVSNVDPRSPRGIDDVLETMLAGETDAGRVAIRRVLVSLASSGAGLVQPLNDLFAPYALSQLRQAERDGAERLVRAGILCVRYDAAEEGRVITPVDGDLFRESSTVKAWLASYGTVIEWKREIGSAYARATSGLAEEISLSDAAWNARVDLERDFWEELTPREQRIWRVVKERKRTELRHAAEMGQAQSKLDEALAAAAAGRRNVEEALVEYRRESRVAVIRQARVLAAITILVVFAASAFSLHTRQLANAEVARSRATLNAWQSIRRGHFAEAKTSFTKLIGENPEDPSYFMGRAYAESRRLQNMPAAATPQDWALVAGDSEAAVKLQADHGELVDPETLNQLAHFYQSAGDASSAAKAFDRFKRAVALTDNPETYSEEIRKGY